MPLTLVLGPANSAKAGEVFGAYSAAAERGALLVVPTAADAQHYSRELAEQGCVLAAVLTFAGLAEEIALRAGYAARRLTSTQRERVLERALATAKLGAVGESAGTTGFVAAAGALIAELARSLVEPARFAAATARWAEEDPRRAGYARDLASIYFSYSDELNRLGRVDAELYAWRALDALRTAPGRWGATPVFFYGFDDLHPLERDTVETLSRVADAEVVVSLTYEAGREALKARAELVEDLRPLAQRVIELPALDEYYEPEARRALHHLERRLFEQEAGDERIDPGPAIRLLEAAGERAEAELVAAEVIALLGAGVPGEEIAVVYRSLPAVASLVIRVFEQYGIPLSLERRLPLRHTALGRSVLALGRCALRPAGASAQDVIDYLRSPGLLDRREVADNLELKVLRNRLSTAAQARAQLGFELDEIDALARSRDPAKELIRHARRLLAAPHKGAAAILDEDERLDARALAATVAALEELNDLQESLSPDELIDLLEKVEVDASLPPAPDAVLIAEPLAIRARRFRAVFVCGLQEGRFPLTAPPDPFLSDERRRELAGASGLRLRLHEDPLERERYLFYAGVSRATGAVVLSYRSSDEEGNLELPSPFIADVADLLEPGWRDHRRERLLADLVWPRGEAPTPREQARAAAAVREPAASEAPPVPRTLGAQALSRVRHTEVLSAGALETFASCPVKWLVERELQPARLEPEPDPLARGSYMHRVLEKLLARLGGPVTPESLARALELLEEVVSEAAPDIARGSPERIRRALAERIAADLRRYLVHEASDGFAWEPRELELRFGFGDDEEEPSLPALELGAEGEERVRIRGAIDRVDVDPDGGRAIVRDYKSGSARPEHQGARWSGDGTLQVALYMLAVRELLGLEPVAGLYQPLSGRDLRARGVFLRGLGLDEKLVANDGREPEELRSALEAASARALELARRLRSGELAPCPQTCSRDGCRYPAICRSG